MSAVSFRTQTVTREEFVVHIPAVIGDLEDAIRQARATEVTDGRQWDDSWHVSVGDEDIVIWREVPR